MNLDFCTISTGLWPGVALVSILGGMVVGYALQALFSKAGLGLSFSRGQNFTGGCLLPVVAGILSGFGFNQLIPDDPCNGGMTAFDASLVLGLVFLLVAGGAMAVFWSRIWRRN